MWLFRKAFKHAKFLFYILTTRVTTRGCKSPNKPYLGHPPPLPRSCTEAQAWAQAFLPEIWSRYSCAQLCCPDVLTEFSRLISDLPCPPNSGLSLGPVCHHPPLLLTLFRVLCVCAQWWGQSPACAVITLSSCLPSWSSPSLTTPDITVGQVAHLAIYAPSMHYRWAWWKLLLQGVTASTDRLKES